MNGKETFFHRYYILGCFIVFVGIIACTFLYGKSCGRNEANYNNVNGTIQQATKNIETAGRSVDAAKKENGNARSSIDRAGATVGQVRERAEYSKRELAETRNLIESAIELNRSAQAGLENIRKTNTEDTKAE